MIPEPLAGSLVLQFAFVAIALVLVFLAGLGVTAGSVACGDAPAVTQRMGRRYFLLAAGWLAGVSLVAWSGVLMRWDLFPPPFMPVAFAMMAAGVWLARSEMGDRLARGLPLAWLVGVQAFRLPLELAMHRAYAEGVMPVQLSYEGRNLDVVTGITALVLAVAMTRWRVPRGVVMAWNVMGLALLVNVVGVAIASLPVFAAFGPDRLNVFVTRLPYTLLPMVMVLAAWAGHLIIFRALGKRGQTPF